MIEATLNFTKREDAKEFASAWVYKTRTGHTMKDKTVTVYNVTDELKEWIDSYVTKLNEGK